MTSFKFFKRGREEGIIEVTNFGVSIQDHEELCDLLDNIGSDFRRVGFEKQGDGTNFIFKTTAPTERMVDVLIRLRPYLEDLGYEMAIY